MRTIFWFIYFFFHTLLTSIPLVFVFLLERFGNTGLKEKITEITARTWAIALVKVTNSKVKVIGSQNIPNTTVLFVSNHQSNFDIPLFLGYVPGPKGFIAKKELDKIPIISNWMLKMHSLFLDRKNLRKSLLTMKQAVSVLKEGHSLVVFPEGTRSKSNIIAEFKKGSLSIAQKANVPIVPITIIDSYKIMEGNKYSKIKPAEVKIIISKPIYPAQIESGKEIANLIHEIIKKHLN